MVIVITLLANCRGFEPNANNVFWIHFVSSWKKYKYERVNLLSNFPSFSIERKTKQERFSNSTTCIDSLMQQHMDVCVDFFRHQA